MNQEEDEIILERNVEAIRIPSGETFTIEKGNKIIVTQSMGGSFTVMTGYGMARIEAKDADALGKEVPQEVKEEKKETPTVDPNDDKAMEKAVRDALKNVYDPEIPVNIVDLGLVYDVALSDGKEGGRKAEVKMTLTAPGCGMGPTIQNDAKVKTEAIPGVEEAIVELVWDPPWNQDMITEVGKMKLGMV